MLNVYLTPKRLSLYQPSAKKIAEWLASLQQSGLFDVPHLYLGESGDDHKTHSVINESISSSSTIELTPGIAISHLFNQHAHDALVPAELTIELLTISFSSFPTLLPIEEIEGESRCHECGDFIEEEELDRAISKLDLFPLDTIKVACLSCHDEHPLRSLDFDPPRVFSQFWICLEQSASTRLSPQVLKSWESTLACPLAQLNAQRDDLDAFDGSALFSEQVDIASPHFTSQSRDRYRADRWERKRGGRKNRRSGHRGRGR